LPSRKDDSVRRSVVWDYILGGRNQEIADKHNISLGTVRNIIDELREGIYPEYRDYLSYLSDLRWLSQQLSTRHFKLSKAIAGTLLLDHLLKLHVDPVELPQLLQLLQKVSPPGFPRDAFIKAALRLLRIEEETGLDFIEVEKRATALASQVKNLDEIKSGLEQTIASLQSQEQECRQNLDGSINAAQLEIRRLEESKAAQLANYKLTEERLTKHLQLHRKLEAYGLDFDKLDQLAKVLEEFERHDMQPSEIVKYVSQIISLPNEAELWTGKLEKVRKDLKESTESLLAINSEIAEAQGNLKQIETRKAQLLMELDQIGRKYESYALPIDFAQTLLHLLSDPSKAGDQQLLNLSKTLEAIVKTRAVTKNDLLVDYGRPRDLMILLVETVLGKKLIFKETQERELTALRKTNSDLQFNILGKFRAERDELRKERMSLDAEKQALGEATEDRVLRTAAASVKKGEIFLGGCKDCRTKVALIQGSREPLYPFSCPTCMSSLQPLRNPIPVPFVPLKEEGGPTMTTTA